MKEAQFVNPDEIETLEQYGAALISSMVSLRTLEQFHVVAFQKGILDDDELECSKTICWEIRRLVALYKHQIENVLERTELDEITVMNNLRSLMSGVKVPRKRKSKKKEEQENHEVHNIPKGIN